MDYLQRFDEKNERRRAALRRRLGPALEPILKRHAIGLDILEELVDAVASRLQSEHDVETRSFRVRLLERDGSRPICWICELPIPIDALLDSNESFSIDHVTPRSKGGSQLGFENLRAAHRFCNIIRSTKPKPRTQERYNRFLAEMRALYEPEVRR